MAKQDAKGFQDFRVINNLEIVHHHDRTNRQLGDSPAQLLNAPCAHPGFEIQDSQRMTVTGDTRPT